MAIRKIGSRTITIDGVRYRWRVRQKPTYMQQCHGLPLRVSVEAADRPGAVLLIVADARPDNLIRLEPTVVTPKRVATAIRHAISLGWKPYEPGSPFEIRLPGVGREV